MIEFSIIVAIYNRADELKHLLDSLCLQENKGFEVIVVDDGSKDRLDATVLSYKEKLDIGYHYKENQGAGLARNFGAQHAKGEYLLFIDSDCIAPKEYITNIKANLENKLVDAFGGEDLAHADFDTKQKAISYSMTSFFTTGGVRGSKKALSRFQPRSFNMGIKRSVFDELGGFSTMRVGEDPDLSMSLWEQDYTTAFFENCGVYHKRRTSWGKFAKQVYNFGIARPILNVKHPKYKKLVFWLPLLFLLANVLLVMLALVCSKYWLLPLFVYYVTIFLDSSIKNRSIRVGGFSVFSTMLQLFGYGYGFLEAQLYLNILSKKAEDAFPSHFYLQKDL